MAHIVIVLSGSWNVVRWPLPFANDVASMMALERCPLMTVLLYLVLYTVYSLFIRLSWREFWLGLAGVVGGSCIAR